MKNMKFLGLVTLYHPNIQVATDNIKRYLEYLDQLIIWDNSPLKDKVKEQVMAILTDDADRIVWQGNGENRCIASAVNFAWHHAQENGFDMLLMMDQDSEWQNFADYKRMIEEHWRMGYEWVFTPYFAGQPKPAEPVEVLRLFINSGTVIPIKVLQDIGGADELMPLDALDHDMAIRIQKKGYRIVKLADAILSHTIGAPTFSKHLHLKTSNHNAQRTYSMARSHMICLRKHHDWLTFQEKWMIIKRYYLRRLVLIVLDEEDKWNRIKMLIKGTIEGLRTPI